jgi:hypothetical protein
MPAAPPRRYVSLNTFNEFPWETKDAWAIVPGATGNGRGAP